MNKQRICLGIDLGTTNSAMAYTVLNETKIIENAEGGRTTPSIVFIDPKNGSVEVGTLAKRQAIRFASDVFYLVKRLIGRKKDEASKNINLNYKVVADENGMATIENSVGKKFSPILISSRILEYLRKEAEKKLGTKIEDVVITVPAHFNNTQREATKQAAELAGFKNVLRIINEPTAAALASTDPKENEKVLVYDLGGGTFDISLMQKEDEIYQVIGSEGDVSLGGKDFDNEIFNLAANKILSETKVDPKKSARAMFEIQEASENVKKQLSSKDMADMVIPFLGNEFGKDKDGNPYSFEMRLTRVQYEQLTKKYVDKTMKLCEKVLSDTGISKSEIKKVIMVGGMTRDLQVQESVAKMFGKEKMFMKHNPDEVVALGAAIQGAMILGTGSSDSNVVLLDATSLTLGIETLGGVMTPIISKNSTMPTQETQVFSTAADNQTSVQISVYQGERTMARDNHQLGSFTLDGIEPAPRGVPQIEVTFEINTDGMLKVSARDKKTGKKQEIKIDSNLSADDIKRMKADAEKFKEEDEKKRKLVESKVTLEHMCFQIEKQMDDKFKDEQIHQDLSKFISESKEFVSANSTVLQDDIDARIKEIEKLSLDYLKMKQDKGGNTNSTGTDEQKSEQTTAEDKSTENA